MFRSGSSLEHPRALSVDNVNPRSLHVQEHSRKLHVESARGMHADNSNSLSAEKTRSLHVESRSVDLQSKNRNRINDNEISSPIDHKFDIDLRVCPPKMYCKA